MRNATDVLKESHILDFLEPVMTQCCFSICAWFCNMLGTHVILL